MLKNDIYMQVPLLPHLKISFIIFFNLNDDYILSGSPELAGAPGTIKKDNDSQNTRFDIFGYPISIIMF